MSSNKSVRKAARVKDDEFYTRYEDVEAELSNYDFRGKSVFLNCDTPDKSAFWGYFTRNFSELGLLQVSALGLDGQGATLDSTGHRKFQCGSGDFRESESLSLLRASDIVVTNPPFSLFRAWVELAVSEGKHFIVLGSVNALTYSSIFSKMQQGLVRLGFTRGSKKFDRPDGSVKEVQVRWFTSLPVNKVEEPLVLTEEYTPEKYPRHDNFDAIEVGRTNLIPVGYAGLMAVPLTYLDRHDPERFEIVSGWNSGKNVPNPGAETVQYGNMKYNGPIVNGAAKYFRVVIRWK